MVLLPSFTLPLSPNGPPAGFGRDERSSISEFSTTTAFKDAIKQRDVFLGRTRCIICGFLDPWFQLLQCSHIIPLTDPGTWKGLIDRHYIPLQTKEHWDNDPRNCLSLCPNCDITFQKYEFFLRFIPNSQKLIFINYRNEPLFQAYHGKAVAINFEDRHAPFPSIFMIHEMRVRGFHPFAPIDPDIPEDCPWQDWILADGILDSISGTFIRDGPPKRFGSPSAIRKTPQEQIPTRTDAHEEQSGSRRLLPLDNNVINEILAATRAMPSWKACEVENTSWNGTAEENTQKYISSIGVEKE